MNLYQVWPTPTLAPTVDPTGYNVLVIPDISVELGDNLAVNAVQQFNTHIAPHALYNLLLAVIIILLIIAGVYSIFLHIRNL